MEEYENFNIELQEQRRHHRHSSASMHDGPAAPSVFSATDRTSGPVICSYMTGWGSQGQGVRGDNRGQINRFGFWVFQFQ